jgi:hypothetical protein
MGTIVCPGRDDLTEYLLGVMEGERADAIDVHLAVCPACIARARGLIAEDEFTQAIRAGRPAIEDDVDEWADLIMHGVLLQAEKSTVETSKTPTLTGQPLSPLAAAPPEIDFLEPAQQPDEIGRLADYRILEVIGLGGMGVVFRAEDPRLNRQLAIKVMLPAIAASRAARERFLREARAMASIEHDNIVAIHHVGEDRGLPYFAMPLLRGESLESRLPRTDRFSVAEVLRIGREICAGLGAAHRCSLIHRDIKPDNIWLESAAGRVKILDFGLAREIAGDADLTHAGHVVGTPRYMSPEQASGLTVDHRSDLFSVGCVLYRLAAGTAPFEGDGATAVLDAVVNKNARPLVELRPDAPPALAELVRRLLAKSPTDRPTSAAEVDQELARIESQLAEPPQPGRAPTTPYQGQAAVGSRPHLSRWLAGGLVAAALGLVAWWAAGAIFKIESGEGTLVIKTASDDVAASVAGKKVTIENVQTRQRVRVELDAAGAARRLAPGEYRFLLAVDGLRTETDRFTIAEGEQAEVNVWWEPKLLEVQHQADAPAGKTSANYALAFDGNDDIVEMPSLTYDGKRPITIELRARPASDHSKQQVVLVANYDFAERGDFGIGLFQRGDSYPQPNFVTWALAYAGRNGSSHSLAGPAEAWEVGRTTHLAFVAKGKKYRFFIDGKLWKYSELGDAPAISTKPFSIGGSAVLKGSFHGEIDEVRISRTARYEDDYEPEARFKPDKDTVALYHCDEGRGETLVDSSGNKHDGKIVGAEWVKQ